MPKDDDFLGNRIRFTGEEPEKYAEWRIWAYSRLRKASAKGHPAEQLVDVLIDLLTPGTPAFGVLKKIKPEILERSGAEKLVFAELDKLYPIPTADEETTQSLTALKSIKPENNELTSVFLGRLKSLFDTADVQGLKYPDKIKADMLLDSLNMPEASHRRRRRVASRVASLLNYVLPPKMGHRRRRVASRVASLLN